MIAPAPAAKRAAERAPRLIGGLIAGLSAGLSERLGRRAVGIVAALILELLLIALLLSLGQAAIAPPGDGEALVTFDARSAPAARQESAEQPQQVEAAPLVSQPRTEPPPALPPPALILPRANPLPAPQPTQAAIIPLSRDELADADIAALAPTRRPEEASGGPAYGPSLAAAPGDSEVVGRAPNGEPLYAARWFREPTHGEMHGYLSTASSPGWALIACRTAPQWRVEDCVGLGEYPNGSNLQRAALAAAWQFQVRPPRRGGQSLVGSWVRIRIELTRS